MKTFYVLLSLLLPVYLPAQNIDIDLLKKINPAHPRSDLWTATSHSAYWIPPAAAAGTLVTGIIKKDRKLVIHGYQVIINTAISAGVPETMKLTFRRDRPAEAHPNVIYPAEEKHGRSFPSGHTIMAFATATTLSLQYKKWYVAVPAYTWAGAVGYSRLYRGVHYPSDVLAGAAIGVGTGYLSHWLTRKIFNPAN
ncbi:MAG: phosphatase PAP2 family protein [Chitinophagaceae bacterium]|nr:phosphatase PAP2 family protein [Chitinophagaceae bacterium]